MPLHVASVVFCICFQELSKSTAELDVFQAGSNADSSSHVCRVPILPHLTLNTHCGSTPRFYLSASTWIVAALHPRGNGIRCHHNSKQDDVNLTLLFQEQ